MPMLRDRKMIEVYHQLVNIECYNSDAALKIMERQVFFLESSTMYNIIFYNKENMKYFDELTSGVDREAIIEKKGKQVVKQLSLI